MKGTISRVKRKYYNDSNWMQGEIQVLRNVNWNLQNSKVSENDLLDKLQYITLKLCESEKEIKMKDVDLVNLRGKMVETEQELVALRVSSKKLSEVNRENSPQHDREIEILRKDIEKLKNNVKGKEKAIKDKREAIRDLEDVNTMYENQIQEQQEELKSLKLKSHLTNSDHYAYASQEGKKEPVVYSLGLLGHSRHEEKGIVNNYGQDPFESFSDTINLHYGNNNEVGDGNINMDKK